MPIRLHIALFILASATLSIADSFAHSGGTNANGCHTNHKTGNYHCHNRKTPAASLQTYCRVVNGERNCGYSYSSCNALKKKLGGQCEKE